MRKIGVLFLFLSICSLSYGQHFYLARERVIGISNLGAGWIPYAPGVYEYNLNTGLRLGYFPLTSLMAGVELNYQLIFANDLNFGTTENARSPGANLFLRYYWTPERLSFFTQVNLGGLYYVRDSGARTKNAYYGEVLLGVALRPVEKFSIEVSSGIRRFLNISAAQGGKVLILNFIPKIGANYHF